MAVMSSVGLGGRSDSLGGDQGMYSDVSEAGIVRSDCRAGRPVGYV